MIATVVAVAWGLGGTLSTVQSSIATEAKVRELEMSHIKERLDSLPRKADTPSKAQFQKVEEFITENGHSFQARCNQLTKLQKVHLDRQIRLGLLPPEMQCIDGDGEPERD